MVNSEGIQIIDMTEKKLSEMGAYFCLYNFKIVFLTSSVGARGSVVGHVAHMGAMRDYIIF
jgi:hypothetical protein